MVLGTDRSSRDRRTIPFATYSRSGPGCLTTSVSAYWMTSTRRFRRLAFAPGSVKLTYHLRTFRFMITRKAASSWGANNCVQATPDYAMLFIVAQVSGAPDAARWAKRNSVRL